MAQEGGWVGVDLRAKAPSIVKVGGSLLRRPEDYGHVAEALAARMDEGPTWAVVSAASGATDALDRIARGAEAPSALISLHERLFGGAVPLPLLAGFAAALKECAASRPERLMAWGEQASATLLQQLLRKAGRPVDVVELCPSMPAPQLSHALVPGFYVRGRSGLRLLPRGGSDVSAVLAARWVGSRDVRLWKEGGGIRLDPGVTVERIDAASVLAWLAGRVRPLHPCAVRLAERSGLPLVLEDPWGLDGATTILPTRAPNPSTLEADGVADEAAQ